MMDRFSTVIAAAFLVSATCQPVLAADCKQASAVYADHDGAYELRFTPINSDAAVASNQFKLSVLRTALVFDGYVMPSDDPVRADGLVMFNCPTGDATTADLNACTIWQGTVYGVNANGDIDNLQPEGADAADKVVLAGLGPAIRASAVWGAGKATVAPWDVFAFKECAK
jgi:hypothetical protein